MVNAIRSVIKASSCANCRKSLLRTFTALSGVPWHTTQLVNKQVRPGRRHFSYSTIYHEVIASNDEIKDGEDISASADTEEVKNLDSQEEANVENSSPVPWYLQVDAPSKNINPLSERQRIPDLPESSPNILDPLLKQISIDLGLDDLALLDLRNLDPPPALGANLIMIVGTARSEKHLHVSADRLCRWLRSNYKLKPDADGLLGRNELKLKMKRKNRRAKLTGDTTADDADDGIRTGWVCVNVGTVQTSPDQMKEVPQDESFVGFGRQSEGIKIVVQMMVEEKREELNLEKLWTGIANRQLHQINDAEENDTRIVEPSSSTSETHSHAVTSNTSSRLSTLRLSGSSQSRGLHTTTRRMRVAEIISSDTEPFVERISEMYSNTISNESNTQSQSKNYPGTRRPVEVDHNLKMPLWKAKMTDLDSLDKLVTLFLKVRDYKGAFSIISQQRNTRYSFLNGGWREYYLAHVRDHLESLPTDEAIKALGGTPLPTMGARKHSDFQRYFHRAIPRFPTQYQWECRIWLITFGRKITSPPIFQVKSLYETFLAYQQSGATIEPQTYMEVIESLIRNKFKGCPDHERDAFPTALMVLKQMHDRGNNVLSEDSYVSLLEIFAAPADRLSKDLAIPPNAEITSWNLPIRREAPLQARLHTLLSAFSIPITSDHNWIRLMEVHASQNDWIAFFDVFRTPTRRGKPRSAALYAHLFHRVSATRHQRGCMAVLRTWIPEMDREDPPVKLSGNVLRGVLKCLDVADFDGYPPKPNGVGEWNSLWLRCQQAIKDEEPTAAVATASPFMNEYVDDNNGREIEGVDEMKGFERERY